MKRAYMECGGKSPNVVFADAPSLKQAAYAAASGIFYNQGEVCTAASRLLVERSVKDEFVAMVVEAGKTMHPRHPLDPDAPMGAMVDDWRRSTSALRRHASSWGHTSTSTGPAPGTIDSPRHERTSEPCDTSAMSERVDAGSESVAPLSRRNTPWNGVPVVGSKSPPA